MLELTKSIKERSYNLSCLEAIKLPELNSKGKPKRMCAWCAEVELLHGNQKYCTQECSNSAMAWAYPQKEDSLKFLLMRQEWKCLHCQYDYLPFLQKMIEKDAIKWASGSYWDKPEKLPWNYFKRLKSQVPQNRKPEVDHILAIRHGGESLGLSNHQILCYSCHKAKTKIDNSSKKA